MAATPDLVLGTVDAWVIWNLTGGTDGGVVVTDATNASRTLLYDIRPGEWSEELGDIFGVPLRRPPDVRPVVRPLRRGGRGPGRRPAPPSPGWPVSGVAGDQQAALFGQACFSTGDGQGHLWDRQLRPGQRR